AAYAQLQFFQFPYDADGIQSADQLVVSELKKMSDLKQSYVKKQLDPSAAVHDPAAAEIQEHKNQAVIYKILIKKLESQ
ncbi:DUF641 domain-containing protein, partial [Streptomyces fildesensis]|uniref:DUF641 domain-containing protein n=1 Tax=Streptomyces fildesensis TaxID=375757 RepID=UPI0018E03758